MRSSGAARLASMAARVVVAGVVIVFGIALTAASPILTVALIVWLVFSAGGWMIGYHKGRGTAGLFLGLLLGPFGLLIVAVMEPSEQVRTERERATAAALAAAVRAPEPGDTRACPWCAETIKTAAIICRHCGRDVEPSPGTPTSEVRES